MARNRSVLVKDWPGYNPKHRILKGNVWYWEHKAMELSISINHTDAIKADMRENCIRWTLIVHTYINTYYTPPGSVTNKHIQRWQQDK